MHQELSWYVVIPSRIILDDRLTGDAKLLYGILSGLTREKGYCWATNKYLAEKSGQKDRTMRRNLAKLEECGYIRFDIIRTEEQEVVERRIYLQGDHTPMVKSDHTPMVTGDQYNNKEENIKEEYPQASPVETDFEPLSAADSGFKQESLAPRNIYELWGQICVRRGILGSTANSQLSRLIKEHGKVAVSVAIDRFQDVLPDKENPFTWLQAVLKNAKDGEFTQKPRVAKSLGFRH